MAFVHLLLSAMMLFAEQASALNTPKAVFARVIMTNTRAHTQSTWEQDITLAQAAGIDAFALNMGYTDPYVPTQLAHAFAAAEALGSHFKLFLQFDYTGGGKVWPSTGNVSVVSYLQEYLNSTAYYMYEDLPFTSAIEGLAEAADWGAFGSITNIIGPMYFAPDYTAEGMEEIFESGPGLMEGLKAFFSFDMWPVGAVNMTDEVDKQWIAALAGGAAYMMGVSPWFFHSASGSKDWVWRGDDLWASRWNQTLDIKPQLIEIVSWNDYGTSSYIGPVHSNSEVPAGSLTYVEGMPHDSWRDFLPYYIAKYKGTAFTIAKDQMQYWYHTSPTAGGSTCGVVGNNADRNQTEISPNAIVEDGIFFSALLTAPAQVGVKIGNYPVAWYSGTAGINHWSRPFKCQTGVPTFSVVRYGEVVGSGTGVAITANTTLSNGCTNYNAWVGSFQGRSTRTGERQENVKPGGA